MKGSDRFKELHWGDEPNRIIPVELVVVERFIEVGKLMQVTYRTSKGGEVADFVHDFGKPYPILATDEKGKFLSILGGGFKVRAAGIIG